jgi:hypothetical protein
MTEHGKNGTAVAERGPGADVVATVNAHMGRQRDAWTRRTRLAMLAQAALMAALGGLGLWSLAPTETSSTTVGGIRLGYPVLLVLVLAAVAIAVTAPWPHQALRRVALASAIVWTSVFVAGAVYYPGDGTAWASNAGTAALLATLALASFIEFVLLNAEAFDPAPGLRP